MKLATTTADFGRYLDDNCDKIKELKKAGFKTGDIYDLTEKDFW